MAGNTSNVSFSIDSELKEQADLLFTNLGIDMTAAFHIFLRQSVREGGIPFEVTMYPKGRETAAAMCEAEEIAKDPSVEGFLSMEALIADLDR